MNEPSGNRFLWEQFEKGLQQELDLKGVNILGVEEKLMKQIKKAGKPGSLSPLKIHPEAPEIQWDTFESNLFKRITEFEEYDTPVNSAISADETLPEAQWQRLESKIESDIQKTDAKTDWERYLKSEQYLTMGQWERIQNSLFKKIVESSNDYNWKNLLKANIDATSAPGEYSEEELKSSIENVDDMQVWERVLKKENILSEQNYNEIESKLMKKVKLEKQSTSKISSLWLTLGWFSFRQHGMAKTLGLLLLAVASWFTWQQLQPQQKMSSFVYLARGHASNSFKQTYSTGSIIHATSGSSVTLVNKRGYVDLKNGSKIKIVDATGKVIRYRVVQTHVPNTSDFSSGNATFYVNKVDSRQKFLVETPDYQINVTGTFFKVQSDFGGHFTTQVMEGSVVVDIPGQGILQVRAGQKIVYDYESAAFAVRDGGPAMSRHEIEMPPEFERLKNYDLLKITTNVPRAEISLNGIYMGESPLSILQAPGRYGVKISRENYHSLDTILVLTQSREMSFHFNLAAVLSEPEKPAKQRPALPTANTSPNSENKMGPEPVRENSLASARDMESRDWKNAIVMYQAISQGRTYSKLDKENALFRIAQLKAHHLKNKQQAVKEFLNYLALFPDGVYAGESWLRLAELVLVADPGKAIEYYLKYFKKYPNHRQVPGLQHRVGLVYLQMNNYEAAIHMFEESLAGLMPSQKSLRENIFWNYHKALVANGELQKADHIQGLMDGKLQ